MKNYVQKGDTITAIAPYNVASGAGAKVGLLFGIAVVTALSGAEVELKTDGVFDVAALSTDTASGTTLVAAYWDDTNKYITTTAGANLKVGVIVAAKISGDTTARVRLNGVF